MNDKEKAALRFKQCAARLEAALSVNAFAARQAADAMAGLADELNFANVPLAQKAGEISNSAIAKAKLKTTGY